jgi:hypothetical protein
MQLKLKKIEKDLVLIKMCGKCPPKCPHRYKRLDIRV